MGHASPAAVPPETFDLGRIRLRRPRVADAEAVFEYASDPEVARYADWPTRTTIESVVESLGLHAAEWEAGVEFKWVMTLAGDDRAIGGVSCCVGRHSAELGYLMNRRFWGKGYATEAARGIVEWVFSVPSIWRPWATCDVENVASARVLEKAGLSREGIMRRAMVRPNLAEAPRDAYLYARVRE